MLSCCLVCECFAFIWISCLDFCWFCLLVGFGVCRFFVLFVSVYVYLGLPFVFCVWGLLNCGFGYVGFVLEIIGIFVDCCGVTLLFDFGFFVLITCLLIVCLLFWCLIVSWCFFVWVTFGYVGFVMFLGCLVLDICWLCLFELSL